MKLQLLAFAALASVIAATSAKAQYALSPYGPQAPAPLVLGSGIEPVPAPYYDAAVVPAGSMAAGGLNSSAACDTAGCGCGSGGAMTGLLAGWFNGSSACGGSCGGSCGGACGGACGGSCGGSCNGSCGGACGGACGMGMASRSCGGGSGPCGSPTCGQCGLGYSGNCLEKLFGHLHALCGGHGHFGALGPDGSGACCNPRYFDFQAEWLFWQREDAGQPQAMATLGVLGPVVLSTDDLDFDEQSGVRVTGAYIVGPSTNIEATYFGTFNWSDAVVATSADGDLFSVYSDFGFDPIGGFPETDEALRARIAYSSALDNGEINLRRRWTSANCLLHGSWLAGVRYLSLIEDFEYATVTDTASLNSLTSTDNDLIGFQLGGELLVCVTSRLKVGAEAEGGLYGLKARQNTQVTTSTQVALHERAEGEDVAFVAEGGAMALFRLTPRFTLRGGYQLLYVDGVALATENFNTASPFSIRSTVLNDNGNAFYHGVTSGFEWTW